jgi:hypothetical protein
VINGTHPGRRTSDLPEEITLFDGTGVGLQDLAATMVAVMLPLTSIGLDLGMDDKTMRPMTINTALLFGSLYTLATFMGVVLSLWPAAETGREQYA